MKELRDVVQNVMAISELRDHICFSDLVTCYWFITAFIKFGRD